jgi:hypothetical protein
MKKRDHHLLMRFGIPDDAEGMDVILQELGITSK